MRSNSPPRQCTLGGKVEQTLPQPGRVPLPWHLPPSPYCNVGRLACHAASHPALQLTSGSSPFPWSYDAKTVVTPATAVVTPTSAFTHRGQKANQGVQASALSASVHMPQGIDVVYLGRQVEGCRYQSKVAGQGGQGCRGTAALPWGSSFEACTPAIPFDIRSSVSLKDD
jgi:hypothetical protein